MNTNRFKNVGFWIGIVGIVLTAAGIVGIYFLTI